MRSIFRFVSYNLKQVFMSPKPYIVFFMIYGVIRIGLGGVNTYLTDHNQFIQAFELFIFAHSAVFFQIIFILGLLFLIGDAPFLKEGMSLRLIRTSRSKWLVGQILSCIIIAAIYLLVIEVLLVILCRNRITFQNQWSDPIQLAAQVNVGGTVIHIKTAIYFSMEVLKAGSPYGMFLLTFVYNLLLYTTLSLVVITCNLRFASGVGIFAVAMLIGEKLVQRYILPYRLLWNLSPCSVVCLCDQPITRSGIAYTILFLTTLCGCLILWSLRLVRTSDLLRRDYA